MTVRLLTVGDNVVDRYVERGYMYPGGNAVNVAVHGRRVGAHTAYIGVVGTDASGQAVLRALESEQVDCRLTRVVEGPNASADVRVVDGNRVFGSGRPGVSVFTLTPSDLAAAGDFDIVHTGECSSIEGQLAALRAASRRLSFDFSERPWDYVEAHAPQVSIANASCPGGDLTEATRLAHAIRELGPDTVSVTLGAAGAILLADRLYHSPAGDGPVVDTLGAGDAFIARLLFGLARGEPAQAVLSAATTYASAACASYGAFGHETPLELHDNALLGTARWEAR